MLSLGFGFLLVLLFSLPNVVRPFDRFFLRVCAKFGQFALSTNDGYKNDEQNARAKNRILLIKYVDLSVAAAIVNSTTRQLGIRQLNHVKLFVRLF